MQSGAFVKEPSALPRRMQLVRRQSVIFATAKDLLGGLKHPTSTEAATSSSEVDQIDVRPHVDTGPEVVCESAETTLLIPLSFWKEEDKMSSGDVAKLLLSRKIPVEQDEECSLWESAGFHKVVGEFSLHFRTLLGCEDDEEKEWTDKPMHRLRLSVKARAFLFSVARVWADTEALKDFDFIGKLCEWKDVVLTLFPHGAVLAVTLDWIPSEGTFTLSDLRSWLYVAKMRSMKVGVARGWSFGVRTKPATEEGVRAATDAYGLKLFACLFGGSCVSLAAIANWLVKLPAESSDALPRRVTRQHSCLHHTLAVVEKRPAEEQLKQYMYHITKAYGSRFLRPVPDASYLSRFTSDCNISLKDNTVLLGLAREGVFGLEILVEGAGTKRAFLREFCPVSLLLTVHCLSERVTLEKLSYLAALRSQSIDDISSPKDRRFLQLKLSRLNSLLIRYRISMSSDDCGGSVEARKFFKLVRFAQDIAQVKNTLQEQLQDANYILNCNWTEERQKTLDTELRSRMQRDRFKFLENMLKDKPKNLFDLVVFSFVAVLSPVTVISALWGMNVSDLALDVSWYYLLLGSCLFSVVLIVVFLILGVGPNRKLSKFKSELKFHLEKASFLQDDDNESDKEKEEEEQNS